MCRDDDCSFCDRAERLEEQDAFGKMLNEKSMNCPQCGTLVFIDIDLFAKNRKMSLLRCKCPNCNYDAPVHIVNGEWTEWK